MIQVEYPYNDNENLIRHYSDEGYTILQMETGNEYDEAIDLVSKNYTYQETDHLIEAIKEEEL